MKKREARSHVCSVAKTIRAQIEAGGERIWRLSDFKNMPATAIAQTLSRLFRLGIIQRLGKGLYYRPKKTTFGPSQPNPGKLSALPILGKGIFPAGSAAANLLGFSTQQAAKLEISTNGLSLPRLIVGKDTIIHTRRPESWKRLSSQDAALLDLLRSGCSLSEFSPKETVNKLLKYFHEAGRFNRILQIAITEPPRVRAILGAIGQELGYSEKQLCDLKKSLNPLSRFDFGSLIELQFAKQWQAKVKKLEII